MSLARSFKAGGGIAPHLLVASATVELPPDIPLVIFNPMLFQQLAVFLLKGLLAVMLALILDIGDDARNIGPADGECSVAVLPGELTHSREFSMNPFR